MRKVVIVDDEIWAVEGLRSAIDWKEFGYDIVATYTSSEKALDFLTHNTVDVAILDIMMPGIDGLTMVPRIKEYNKDIKIIIVSGLTEFETARQAVSLGVDEYLVKPLDTEALKAALCRIKESPLADEYRALPDISTLNNQFVRIGGDSGKTVLSSYLGLYKRYSYYFLVMSDRPDSARSSDFNNAFTLSGECLRFKAYGDNLVFVCFTDVYIEQQKLISRFKSDFSDMCFGISLQKTDISEMPKAISECRQAYYNHFITGKKRVFEYRETDRNFFNTFMQSVSSGIQERSLTKLDMTISNVFENTVNFHIDELILLCNSCLLAANMMSSAENYEYIPAAERIKERFDNIEQLEDFLHHCIKSLAVKQSDEGVSLSKRSIMPMIKEYIDKNFQERISLTDLSEKFGISEKYLSKMFKKYTGENYAQYLNKVRIGVALQMLQKTHLSVREIAEACGYSDYPYFARVFKKLVGESATDIRRNLPQ